MNKFYIQVVFFLLSVSVYPNNKTLGSEPNPGKAAETKSKDSCATSEEIYEQNKHLLCPNPEEANAAIKLMGEALIHLVYHATNKEGYKYIGDNPDYDLYYYKKKHNDNTNVEKYQYKVRDPNKYNETINELWDPNSDHFLDRYSCKKKIVRVYSPNLVIIQQRYKNWPLTRQKYFYVLVKKSQISENKTIITMTSPNINDGYPSDKEYKNRIIENANLFTTDIDSEEDIRNGKLNKAVVNIAGYIIQKKSDHIYVTFIRSHYIYLSIDVFFLRLMNMVPINKNALLKRL
ncbi:fam-a protein [Plasmodium vinckei lentum]|uniref:Fam-a protein n=1 Tax=Plasmodium vinckei lentum TaxID=138297 RepID=A0A6V7SMG0_PLAVN|nr:fam-a protein [Plasmodium vinckei lentum]